MLRHPDVQDPAQFHILRGEPLSVCMQLALEMVMHSSCPSPSPSDHQIFEIDSTDGRNVQNGGSVVSAHFHPRVRSP